MAVNEQTLWQVAATPTEAAIFLLLAAAGVPRGIRALARYDARTDGYSDVGLGLIVAAGVVCGAIGVICFFSAIPWLANPQWSAIQMIPGR